MRPEVTFGRGVRGSAEDDVRSEVSELLACLLLLLLAVSEASKGVVKRRLWWRRRDRAAEVKVRAYLNMHLP